MIVDGLTLVSAPSPKFNVDLPIGPDEPKAESERLQTDMDNFIKRDDRYLHCCWDTQPGASDDFPHCVGRRTAEIESDMGNICVFWVRYR
jgi:hypothetical protein